MKAPLIQYFNICCKISVFLGLHKYILFNYAHVNRHTFFMQVTISLIEKKYFISNVGF
jgi:hypothetical protein